MRFILSFIDIINICIDYNNINQEILEFKTKNYYFHQNTRKRISIKNKRIIAISRICVYTNLWIYKSA